MRDEWLLQLRDWKRPDTIQASELKKYLPSQHRPGSVTVTQYSEEPFQTENTRDARSNTTKSCIFSQIYLSTINYFKVFSQYLAAISLVFTSDLILLIHRHLHSKVLDSFLNVLIFHIHYLGSKQQADS